MSENSTAARTRADFSKIKAAIPIPNLIEVQKRSYERFLQMRTAPADRDDHIGLQAVFKSIFPIRDFRETCSLEFVDYTIGNWECKCGELRGIEHLRSECTFCGHRLVVPDARKGEVTCANCGNLTAVTVRECDDCGDPVALKFKYDVEECQERGQTYTVPLKVTIQLVVYDKDPDTEARTIRDIKEQEVYFGEIPMLTEHGTFIVNGTERVIVSQLHRSPGVFFQSDANRTTFLSKVIPYRGSWVEFETDAKNVLHVRIDRKRKFPATIFLRALGVDDIPSIFETFYSPVVVRIKDGHFDFKVGDGLLNCKVRSTVSARGKEVIKKNRRIRAETLADLKKARLTWIPVADTEAEGAFSVHDIVDEETGEVVVEAAKPLTDEALIDLQARGIREFEAVFPEREDVGDTLIDTLAKDTVQNQQEALIEIYRRLRPGDPPTPDSSRTLFNSMFFDPTRYDFSKVGRLKFNTKIYGVSPEDWAEDVRERWEKGEDRTPTREDFVEVLRYMLKLKKGKGDIDDIDHLGNRRVRSVGELLENQFRIGLVRMERAIKEKMSVYQEMTTAMPHDLINAKPVMAAIQEFFGSSQLSQFMDQTNPLSEVTHKRRLSALGPGGLSRERAGFEVRDVHPTHYGRICPIETPEGPNIGLISSLSCFARINDYGFIESPYRRVESGRVLDFVRVTRTGQSQYKLDDVVSAADFVVQRKKVVDSGKLAPEAVAHSFYLSAYQEDRETIAQANAHLGDDG
ncbi:MAG: DNA-directed RNA polymerase subunit beta, partial [Acidobacteriota bacterium]|nr:DNA-directed RNA polymerase subunit beta [Acidobacteriota bacterium]